MSGVLFVFFPCRRLGCMVVCCSRCFFLVVFLLVVVVFGLVWLCFFCVVRSFGGVGCSCVCVRCVWLVAYRAVRVGGCVCHLPTVVAVFATCMCCPPPLGIGRFATPAICCRQCRSPPLLNVWSSTPWSVSRCSLSGCSSRLQSAAVSSVGAVDFVRRGTHVERPVLTTKLRGRIGSW